MDPFQYDDNQWNTDFKKVSLKTITEQTSLNRKHLLFEPKSNVLETQSQQQDIGDVVFHSCMTLVNPRPF